MLKNKWFITAVAILLTVAVAYDVWYFLIREEDGPDGGTVERAVRVEEAGGSGTGTTDTAGGPSDSTAEPDLVELAAERRPGLRDPAALANVRQRLGQQAWGREPLALSGALAGPEEPDEPAPRPATPPGWQLSAVMTGGERRAAVIDGRVVGEGDGVRGGGTVVEIRRGSVVIRWRGRREVVRLRRPE